MHAIENNENDTIVVRSPSGDTDIVVLALGIIPQRHQVVIMDNGKSRKIFKLSSIDMNDGHVQAIIGFHSFTGNHYISSFFRKGKTCWQKMIKYDKYLRLMQQLGSSWEISDKDLGTAQDGW